MASATAGAGRFVVIDMSRNASGPALDGRVRPRLRAFCAYTQLRRAASGSGGGSPASGCDQGQVAREVDVRRESFVLDDDDG